MGNNQGSKGKHHKTSTPSPLKPKPVSVAANLNMLSKKTTANPQRDNEPALDSPNNPTKTGISDPKRNTEHSPTTLGLNK
jgi:hypothetical protein